MPSIKGYNPPKRFNGENAPSVADPNGIWSGMTQGLAQDGDGFCDVPDMPADSRMSGTLVDQNSYFNEDADPEPGRRGRRGRPA